LLTTTDRKRIAILYAVAITFFFFLAVSHLRNCVVAFLCTAGQLLEIDSYDRSPQFAPDEGTSRRQPSQSLRLSNK
jgi:hypothetical protein